MPDPKPPDYEAIELRMWGKNAEEIPRLLENNDKDLLKKLKGFATKFGYNFESVKHKAFNDPMFAANFAKTPNRQNPYENLAAEWLEGLNLVRNFRNLKNRGKDAIYCTNDGEFRLGKEFKGRTKPSKSLDFKWETSRTVWYAAHKYTRDVGGSQDSQFKELLNLLQMFQRSSTKGVILVAIADGPYYSRRRRDGSTKLEELESYARNSDPYSYATPIWKIPRLLRKHS